MDNELGLKRLNPGQHFAVAICRDISLVLILKNCLVFWSKWYQMITVGYERSNLTAAWATEFFLAGIWCIVSGLLSYSILDGLMARWMVMYTVQAAIVRILSMSLLIIVLVELLNYLFNTSDNEFCLPAWIIISCVLTFIYILQNYITSNLRLNEILLRKVKGTDDDDEDEVYVPAIVNAASNSSNNTPSTSVRRRNTDSGRRSRLKDDDDERSTEIPRRTVDLYNLTVFAVVPIGVASFITMCGLVRLVVILRLEVGLNITQLLE
ncbi:hypothetical protein FOA43_004725 [Brettanomyces nanus]|uniref:Uncharacterized protein n=1 Tax=Eeniella nana TaxID=13502 RepID=A0A875S7I3_EENNA|nr:uncharacterized protein FOA43_004725 [Brettanomyces nanus]QPG77316.1 hypothetical protein FOA43_004725 [Brettanomyces nanus]